MVTIAGETQAGIPVGRRFGAGLLEVTMFSMLSATVVERLVHELKVVKFKADENIITMGDLGCDTSLLPFPAS